MADTIDTTTTASDAGIGATIEKAKAFAKQRPWAVGTLAAIVGIATLNTLRGKS